MRSRKAASIYPQSPSAKVARLASKTVQTKSAWKAESPLRGIARLDADRVRVNQVRATESSGERYDRLHVIWKNKMQAAFNYDSAIQYETSLCECIETDRQTDRYKQSSS